LIIGYHDSPTLIREALSAGARGYVFKTSLTNDLLPAIEGVVRIPMMVMGDSDRIVMDVSDA
jgi:DNA-binding NarL/FixJ family response regulator